MTRSDTPPEDGPPAVAPVLRAAAVVLLVLPIAGILVHAVLLVWARDWLAAYARSPALPAAAFAAFANLFASYYHYRHTRMRIDIAARILSNLWIFSVLLILAVRMRGF